MHIKKFTTLLTFIQLKKFISMLKQITFYSNSVYIAKLFTN